MARPTKQAIDYFPVDIHFDEKIEMYILETEAVGLAVLITLWQLIYANEGYYIKNDNDLLLLIKRRIGTNTEITANCIKIAVEREIFDNQINSKYNILTSKAIQKRYFEAAKRKLEVRVFKEYILIDVSDFKNLINVSTNRINESKNNLKEKVKEKGNELLDFKKEVAKYQSQYEISMLKDFVNYWTEKSKSGRMRFELEKFFEVGKRLATWKRLSDNKKPSYQKMNDIPISIDTEFVKTTPEERKLIERSYSKQINNLATKMRANE